MAPTYHFTADGKTKHGPFSLEELKSLAKEGKLRATDMVLQEGTPRWQPAREIAVLFAEVVEDSWVYTADNKNRLGPVTTAQLKDLARSGKLQPGMMVRGGTGKWQPAREVAGLFADSPTPQIDGSRPSETVKDSVPLTKSAAAPITVQPSTIPVAAKPVEPPKPAAPVAKPAEPPKPVSPVAQAAALPKPAAPVAQPAAPPKPALPVSQPAEDSWVYTPDNKNRHGPLTMAQLKDLARSGKLQPSMMVRGGTGKWQPAKEVAGLFSESPTPRVESQPPQPVNDAQAVAPPKPTAPVAQPAEDSWVYTPDNKSRLGPVTMAQLKDLARSGKLLATMMVRGGTGKWQPAKEVAGLFAEPPTPRVAAPPKPAAPAAQPTAPPKPAAPVAQPAEDSWVYTPDNKSRLGPVTMAQLKDLARSGKLQPDAMVRGGTGKWQPAKEVAGLFAEPPTPRVAAPPRPAAPSAQPAEDSWVYTPDNKSRLGPVTMAQLKELARSGKLQPSMMVRGGTGKWQPAKEVAGLFADLPMRVEELPKPASPVAQAAEPPKPASPAAQPSEPPKPAVAAAQPVASPQPAVAPSTEPPKPAAPVAPPAEPPRLEPVAEAVVAEAVVAEAVVAEAVVAEAVVAEAVVAEAVVAEAVVAEAVVAEEVVAEEVVAEEVVAEAVVAEAVVAEEVVAEAVVAEEVVAEAVVAEAVVAEAVVAVPVIAEVVVAEVVLAEAVVAEVVVAEEVVAEAVVAEVVVAEVVVAEAVVAEEVVAEAVVAEPVIVAEPNKAATPSH